MTAPGDVVVVGASLAGLRAAEALRRGGFQGRLTMIGEEPHFPPYDRPPLSKEVLTGAFVPERARLRTRPGLGAGMRLGHRATGLDIANHEIRLDDGSAVGFDGLIIATGATPRRLPERVTHSLAGIMTLRTIEDSLALRRELAGNPRVVVIGAGFLGTEVASACCAMGIHVTVIEALSYPLMRVLGPEIGRVVADLHRDNGVRLLLDTAVAECIGDRHVEQVLLADGSTVPADLVVVAVGAEPETSWLAGSGLLLEDGVVLDETCAALGTGGIVAAGDVARWRNARFGVSMRIEHWTNAVDQAETAAANLLRGPGNGRPFVRSPTSGPISTG